MSDQQNDFTKDAWKKFGLFLILIVPALLKVAWRAPKGLRARYKVNRVLGNLAKDSNKRDAPQIHRVLRNL